MGSNLQNDWIVIGPPNTSEGGFKVTMRSDSSDPKKVAKDIAFISRFASDYERVEFKGDNPVIEVNFVTSAQFEKFSKELKGT